MNKKMILRKKYRSTPFSLFFRVTVCMTVSYFGCTSYVLWVYFVCKETLTTGATVFTLFIFPLIVEAVYKRVNIRKI